MAVAEIAGKPFGVPWYCFPFSVDSREPSYYLASDFQENKSDAPRVAHGFLFGHRFSADSHLGLNAYKVQQAIHVGRQGLLLDCRSHKSAF